MSGDPGEALRNAASRLVGFASLLVNETSLFAQHYNAAPLEERERFKASDGPPISSSRLSRFERNPGKFPLTEAENLRRRAAIKRLSLAGQGAT